MKWLGTKVFNSKDYYNQEDLCRVITNTAFLNAELRVHLQQISFNVDITTIPTVELLNNIEGNIENIANAFYFPEAWEERRIWKHGDTFNYKDANRLENNLLGLYQLYDSMIHSYHYCGDFLCGGDVHVY